MNMARTQRYAIGKLTVIDMLLVAFGIYWLCMLPALFSETPVSQAATRFLLLPAAGVMYWATVDKMNQIARATAVLGNLRAPGSLWRQLSGEGMQRIGLIWALLATGTTLQLALPGGHTAPIAGAALISLAGCLAMLHSVARTGTLPVSSRNVDLALVALVLPLLLFKPQQSFNWFAALPISILALAMAGFPLLVWALERRWRANAPAWRWREPQRGLTLFAALAGHLGRYTVLVYRSRPDAMGWSVQLQSTRKQSAFMLTILPLMTTMFTPIATHSDGDVQVIRTVTLIGMAAFLSGGLVVRDLHWRSFLMPGGMRKGSIASEIWVTTLLLQCGFMALALCAMALALAALGRDPSVLSAVVLRHATLPLEMACAIAIALVLRSLGSTPMFLVGLLLVCMMVPWQFAKLSQAYLPVSVALYAAVLVSVTAATLAIANRLWTINKLSEASGWTQQN